MTAGDTRPRPVDSPLLFSYVFFLFLNSEQTNLGLAKKNRKSQKEDKKGGRGGVSLFLKQP